MPNYIHEEKIHNFKAAEIIVPIIIEKINPKSVVDVGCGLATWLKVFKDYGIKKVLGIDGNYVDKSLLKISTDEFTSDDLTLPLKIERFDLALCLEVAEHLAPGAAYTIVKSLVKASDVILFSAAIPGQGGQNHLNEQWPSYWQELFAKHGYSFYDIIRPLIWNNDVIEYWYRQNIFIVSKIHLADFNDSISSKKILDIVHPDTFNKLLKETKKDSVDYDRISFRKMLAHKIRSRINNLFN